MMSLDTFLGRHSGEAAWVFGKGPSLDGFDMSSAGCLRICVNESALVVPDPTYFFAHDERPIARVAKTWPATCTAVLELARARYGVEHGIPSDSIATYRKVQGDEALLDMRPEDIAEAGVLYGNLGTVHSAIHFCYLCGVERMTLVGFDGEGGYAECISTDGTGWNHSRIRDQSVTMLRKLRIEYEFAPVPE